MIDLFNASSVNIQNANTENKEMLVPQSDSSNSSPIDFSTLINLNQTTNKSSIKDFKQVFNNSEALSEEQVIIQTLKESGIDLEKLWEQFSLIQNGHLDVSNIEEVKRELKQAINVLNQFIRNNISVNQENKDTKDLVSTLNNQKTINELRKTIKKDQLLEKMNIVKKVGHSFQSPTEQIIQTKNVMSPINTNDEFAYNKIEMTNSIKKDLGKILNQSDNMNSGAIAQYQKAMTPKFSSNEFNFDDSTDGTQDNFIPLTNENSSLLSTKNSTEIFSDKLIQDHSSLTEEANSDTIIKQTHFLIKKGGGEANIKLNPEGLGELKLKVNVENGSVNLEVLAENQEVKSILEKSLVDLKQALGKNQLALDSVKVVMSEQNHFDSSQQGFKQEGQSFLQDYRDANQHQRRQIIDSNGNSIHKNNSSFANSDTVTNTVRSNPRNNTFSSRRLNLVA